MAEEKVIKRAMNSIESQVRDIYYQGYKNGRKEAVKRVVCKGKHKTMEGYLDESRQLVFFSYTTVEGLRMLGFDIMEVPGKEEADKAESEG